MFIQELWLREIATGLQQHARATGRSLTAGPLLPVAVTRPSYIFSGIGVFSSCKALVVLGWGVSVTRTCEPAARC